MKEKINNNITNEFKVIGALTSAKFIALQSYLNTSFNDFYMRRKEIELARAKAGEPYPYCDFDKEVAGYDANFTIIVSLINALATTFFLFRAFTLARQAGQTKNNSDLFMSVFSLAMLFFLDICHIPRLENETLANKLATYNSYKLVSCQKDCDKYNRDMLVGFGGIPKEYTMTALFAIGFFSAAVVGKNYWAGVKKRQSKADANDEILETSLLELDANSENDAISEITL